MARTWYSVTVELLGRTGEELWPWPGRAFAVGPSHTFWHLAEAINIAFARWDHAHLSMFTLDDGRIIADSETGAELASVSTGPFADWLDIESTKVGATIDPGTEFCFTFDLGDEWTHRCVMGAEKIDPVDILGIRPKTPLPYWGWGEMPDQYGRRWTDDDGSGEVPPRPSKPHPMLTHEWPGQDRTPTLDLAEVRAAIATADSDRFLAALTGRDIDDALQQVAAGALTALDERREKAESIAVSLINRLTWRSGPGDEELATSLLAHLRRETAPGREVAVDIDTLSDVLTGNEADSDGGYLDLRTGEVIDEVLADPSVAGEDLVIDVDAEPGRWLRVDRTRTRDAWQDMATFAERQRDLRLRERLESAISGAGAFRRFRDLVDAEGLTDQWRVFSSDREVGRAREFLADNEIRVI